MTDNRINRCSITQDFEDHCSAEHIIPNIPSFLVWCDTLDIEPSDDEMKAIKQLCEARMIENVMKCGSPNTKAAIYVKMLDHYHNYSDNNKPDYTPSININLTAEAKPTIPDHIITATDIFNNDMKDALSVLSEEEIPEVPNTQEWQAQK